jgi:hypothetical protein
MKNTKLVEALMATLFVAGIGGSPTLAQHAGHGAHSSSPQANQVAGTKKIKGRIVEIDRNSIAVETQQSGRTETVIFYLQPRTEIKGDLEAGANVVVKYREDDKIKFATSIEVKRANDALARAKRN